MVVYSGFRNPLPSYSVPDIHQIRFTSSGYLMILSFHPNYSSTVIVLSKLGSIIHTSFIIRFYFIPQSLNYH